MKRIGLLAACIATATLFALPASAADFEVKMLNKGADGQAMVFEPAFLHVQSGDTVHFVPADKGHDAESIKGFLPDGAEPFKGKISKDLTVTFQTEGLYGYRCSPHFSMGMVGLIQVGGAPANLDTAKAIKLPPLATKRMAGLFDQAVAQ